MAVAATTATFDMGRVFRNGFALARNRPVTLLAIGFLITFPTAEASTWATIHVAGPVPPVSNTAAYWGRIGLLELIGVVPSGVSWIREGAVALVAAVDPAQRRLSYAAFIGKLFARAPALLVLGALRNLATLGGAILLVIPGIIVSLAWSMGSMVAVLEDRSFTAVLGRSAQLTRGYRMQLFGLFVVFSVASAALGLLVQALGGGALLSTRVASQPTIVGYVLLPLVGALTAPIYSAIMASAYLELRTIKEGLAADHMARMFE